MATKSHWYGGSLFDCVRDCGSCCLGCWCPCVSYARVGEHLLGQGTLACCADGALYAATCWIPGVPCILGTARRQYLRRKFGLPAAPCSDCCVHCCCHPCALCQDHRELRIYAAQFVTKGYYPVEERTFPTQPLLDVAETRPCVIRQHLISHPPKEERSERERAPVITSRSVSPKFRLDTAPAFFYIYAAGVMASLYGILTRHS